jgi:hypothetical protein
VPLYDPTGRLFLMSDNPVLDDREATRLQEEQDQRLGVRSINQVRSDGGCAVDADLPGADRLGGPGPDAARARGGGVSESRQSRP